MLAVIVKGEDFGEDLRLFVNTVVGFVVLL